MKSPTPHSSSSNRTKKAGGERNIHGTRVRRRIECSKCGAEDYVSVNPANKRLVVMCRSCAQKELGTYEMGVQPPEKTRTYECDQCKVRFELPARVFIYKGETVLCPDCIKGFDVWRGSKDISPQERQSMQLQRRKAGTMLRKRGA